MQQCLKFILLE